MAPVPRGLVFVLTLWMVASPLASIRTGSTGSGWWGTQEAYALRQAARAPIQAGDFAESERTFQKDADLAAQHRDPVARAWFLTVIADAHFQRFDYRGALDAYLQAKTQAQQARDRLSLGAIDLDLSSLYQQMWDFDAALRFAEEAQRMVQGLPDVEYRPRLILQLGRLRAESAPTPPPQVSSISLYKEGIELARAAALKDPAQAAVEADGWDLLEEALLAGGDIKDASQAELNALALRQHEPSAARDVGYSYWRLGALRLKEALTQPGKSRENSLNEAELFTRQALRQDLAPPQYLLQNQLGRILLEQGHVPEALRAMEVAVGQAQRRRVGIAPAFPSLDQAATELGARIFGEFVEAAADYGLLTQNQRWIAESFQAAELDRSLSFQSGVQGAQRRRLPLDYWETLGRLQAEGGERASERLEMDLTEMEARAGLDSYSINAENFPSDVSLIHFHQRLRAFEILLSFHLGVRGSFLWAVTRNSLRVYRLPPVDQIRSTVREFRLAIEARRTDVAGRTDVGDIGGRLYTMLFGQLKAQEASKPAWLLSPDDALLELPFAALVPEHERRSRQIVFLAERHSLQVIVGALQPDSPAQRPPRGFLSVGDPIYNVADPRWKPSFLTRLRGGAGNQLNRLPGSRREVESSAAAWGRGPATRVLEGAEANRERFLESLSPAPEVIHLATHALTPASGGEAYLVFSLGANGQPEMLSTSAVQMLQVPGSVVVMTGCTTAPSDVRAGLGLAGLVRAWAVAGASAVVATEWAVRDDAGSSLLSSFYRHLREVPGNVAEALRQAQVEMIHSGTHSDTPQAAPASWAAYQAFGSHLVGTNLKSGSNTQ